MATSTSDNQIETNKDRVDDAHGEISDSLSTIQDNMDKKEKLEKELADQKKNFEIEQKKRNRIAKREKFFAAILSIFKPDFYAAVIQHFEGLLMVIFIDATLLMILFSLLHAMYISISCNNADNLGILIFKSATSLLVTLLCFFIQNNIQPKSQSKEDDT